MAGHRGTSHLQHIAEAFQKFDTDHTGQLDTDEMMKILMHPTKTHGNHMTREEAEEFISYFDKNGDGTLNIAVCLRVRP